jgi:hypothetical protein
MGYAAPEVKFEVRRNRWTYLHCTRANKKAVPEFRDRTLANFNLEHDLGLHLTHASSR